MWPPKNIHFILASGSVRRQEILSITGLKYSIEIPEVDESNNGFSDANIFTKQLAQKKTENIAEKVDPLSVIISADTLIQSGQNVLGKPRNKDEAREMLLSLSGKTHDVITGVCVNFPLEKKILVESLTTSVEVKSLTYDQIDNYIRLNNTLDWAGSYAIQGAASMFISRINGDYFNVVGLPLTLLYDMLLEIRYDLLTHTWLTD